MYLLALIVLAALAAISIFSLNQGPMDREARRREAYWAKFEKDE